MELVGPGLENVIGHALAFVHGFGAVSFHLKLIYRFHRNAERQITGVALGAGAGQRQAFDVDFVLIGLTAVEGSGGRARRLRAVVTHAARETSERRRIARRSIHRQRKSIVNPVVDGGPEGYIVGLQASRLIGDGDRLGGRSDLQRGVHRNRRQRLHNHVSLRQRLKPVGFDHDVIFAGGQQREYEDSGRSRFAKCFGSRRNVGSHNRSPRDSRSRRVSDRAFDGISATYLGERGHGDDKKYEADSNVAHAELLGR